MMSADHEHDPTAIESKQYNPESDKFDIPVTILRENTKSYRVLNRDTGDIYRVAKTLVKDAEQWTVARPYGCCIVHHDHTTTFASLGKSPLTMREISATVARTLNSANEFVQVGELCIAKCSIKSFRIYERKDH
jgi:hypothetical protein